jgi:hypothetical protein
MTTPRLFALTTLAVLCCVLPRAEAGPPFITDDPEPVEYQHWEFYLSTIDFKTSAGWTGTAPHLELNYGAAPGLQLHLIAPLSFDSPKEGPGHIGYGDTELGFKLRFIDEAEGKWWPQVGIFPLVELPTGNHDLGLGNGKAQAFLPVWLQKSWGKWTTYGGGGWWYNPGDDNRNYWFTGVVLQRKITEKFSLASELFYRTPNVPDGKNQIAINPGFIWDISDTYHLIASAGHSVEGTSEFFGYLGFQITWGPEKEK